MMPGVARKVRLAADWTVGLLFGRASAELGQLGHPEALAERRAEPAEGTAAAPVSVLSFREGRAADLRATFELGEAALDASRKERGLLPPDHERDRDDLDQRWQQERALLEFIVAQADGSFVICEDGNRMVGYTRVARFGAMDELTELWVAPSHAGLGVGHAPARALLAATRRRRSWAGSCSGSAGRPT